ncbi:MAG: hypothetical protein ACK4FF_13585 [Limnobacter sp.]|uniref:hypothetical protein n=1 Tax=Limnobacter sp. TaxID=2003368 RepID=UPI00391B3695
MTNTTNLSITLLLSLLLTSPAGAQRELTGSRAVNALTRDGHEIPLGTVDFKPVAKGRSEFKLNLDIHAFTDYFLSMREFKCLTGPNEVACHVPYPYKNPSTVGPGNYTWLEHQLLFLTKSPGEFGAKLWNGVYYEFKDENGMLVGRPRAIDLNDISAPPTDLTDPPLKPANRHDMKASDRWIQELRIR